MFNLKLNQQAVYEDKISIRCTRILSKFVWFGHVLYFDINDDKLFIPASKNGWKWVIDKRDISLDGSTLKLLHSDTSKSYIAIHFNSQDPAPHPLAFTLNIPEFLGNFVTCEIVDEGEREKSLLHPVNLPLEIGTYTVKFSQICNNKVTFEIFN